MATKLSCFNEALRILGQPLLTSPDQAIEDAKQLRGAFDSVVADCYEAGNWNWAIRRVQLSRNATAPAFGYLYYYDLPSDFSRMVQISSSGRPDDDMTLYAPEAKKIATDATTVYLVYVSGELTALPIGDWSQSFANYVSAYLAVVCAPKLKPSALELASQLRTEREGRALSRDAIQSPPALRHPGSFVRAMRGYRFSREQG